MRSLCSPVSTVRTALLSSPMRLCLVPSHHNSIVALWVGETTVTSAFRNAKRLAAVKHSGGFWCGRIRGPVWFLLADEMHRTHGGACGGGLRGVFLRAAASFDYAFLDRAGLDAMVARHGGHLCNDGQLPEAGLNFVEGQPNFRAAGRPRGIDAADVPGDYCAER